MNSENLNYFYAGRIYQYYLDNEKSPIFDIEKELRFILPKREGVDSNKIKNLLKSLLKDEGIIIKCPVLPKKNGWKFTMVKQQKKEKE